MVCESMNVALRRPTYTIAARSSWMAFVQCIVELVDARDVERAAEFQANHTAVDDMPRDPVGRHVHLSPALRIHGDC